MAPSIYCIPKNILIPRLRALLDVDIGFGDISSGLIPEDAQGKAQMLAKSAGILAGIEEAALLFEDLGIQVRIIKMDGAALEKGDKIAELQGNLRNILMGERTALNIIMKMSSIATSVADFVSRIRAECLKTRFAATRKITPGFGWFEKKAAIIGGGDPHRWNLSDMVLLKDTHLAFFKGQVKEMVANAKAAVSFSKKVEVEIERLEDLLPAIEAGADIIMLDNMSPAKIQQAIEKAGNRRKEILLEASGNITIQNFMAYAKTGVDIISTSQPIFHPHKPMDFSLRLQ